MRHLGTDGGRALKWEGKLGLMFGCTEAFDSSYATIGVLGDRFLLYRLPPSQHDQFEMAMLHTGGRFKQMQDELAEAVAGLFVGLGDPLPTPRAMTAEESLRIKRKVILACQLRAGVDRDRYSREIEAVYGAEGAGRIGLALERLLAGLDVVGVDRETALQIVEKVTLDSVPPIRRKVYEALAGGTKKTREVANALDLPTTTVRRALEDITAHGLATRPARQDRRGERRPGRRMDTGRAGHLRGDAARGTGMKNFRSPQSAYRRRENAYVLINYYHISTTTDCGDETAPGLYHEIHVK